jgi:prophage regulatory protein
MAVRFINLSEVMHRTGLAKPTIYQRQRKGTFPKSVPTGGRGTAHVETEIERWQLEQIATGRGITAEEVRAEITANEMLAEEIEIRVAKELKRRGAELDEIAAEAVSAAISAN